MNVRILAFLRFTILDYYTWRSIVQLLLNKSINVSSMSTIVYRIKRNYVP